MMSIREDRLNGGDVSAGCLVMAAVLGVLACLPAIAALLAMTVWMW